MAKNPSLKFSLFLNSTITSFYQVCHYFVQKFEFLLFLKSINSCFAYLWILYETAKHLFPLIALCGTRCFGGFLVIFEHKDSCFYHLGGTS